MQNITTNPQFRIIFLLQIIVFAYNPGYAQCEGNLLVNGSFTSVKGEAVTAPGWISPPSNPVNSPDINDENGPLNTSIGFVWSGTPVASSDGDTWQNMFGTEFVQQTVTLTPGQPYTLCFEYTTQGIYQNAGWFFIGPVGINVFINNNLTYTTPDDTSQYSWENSCFVFTPATASVIIKFQPTDDYYAGIDGACLRSGINSIDENAGIHVNVSGNLITDYFSVNINAYEPAEIFLYDAKSALIMKQNFSNSVKLDTSQLESGIYFYHLRNKKGVIKIGKVIKVK